jgi:hypothetical protein
VVPWEAKQTAHRKLYDPGFPHKFHCSRSVGNAFINNWDKKKQLKLSPHIEEGEVVRKLSFIVLNIS